MDKSPKFFVENWKMIQTLGEGAFGQVKLLVNQTTQQAVAVKIINLNDKTSKEVIEKEVKIHKVLAHPHIIRLFGQREEPETVYIFMEYASGGELFNKIEPDVGMPTFEAQKYMKQILDGVQYLHTKGVAHRDIKPENILLDEEGVIKISDFGMATIFRLRGKERLLDKKCGTLPYVAPEVMESPYKAEPADLWSCGIVLIAMLSGELPWDEPSDKSIDYVTFRKESGLLISPWSKLSTISLSLIRKILAHNPRDRPTINQVLQHPFLTSNYDKDVVDCNTPSITLSQPTIREAVPPNSLQLLLSQDLKANKPICFSQPINNEDLILGSQIQFTQSPVNHTNFQRLIKRMTRFFVTTNIEETIKYLGVVLDQLHMRWSINAERALIVTTTDIRKTKLSFKGSFINMDGKLLVDFQLVKGCGIEFKKRFVKIKELAKDIIAPNP
ncbi:serine/threonine-protein kinase grp-like [Onthophagus taurus]|uniref:serine/threonine-protein kinase grp-like n=1 Tax=Onthophagus taurus TaxID=166361 RepID=UPI000C20F135|nr:serine/threonine-protein kinase grp-like [Onthophagus taurus]